MFAVELAAEGALPDPTITLNEPPPRAWTQGGIIESVKQAVVTGVRNSFRKTTIGSSPGEGEAFHVDIEYPTEEEQYPGIWVQFAIEHLSRAGVAMETWIKDDQGEWGPIEEWNFEGRITLTIAALTSKDRDRLADTVISQLAFSRPSDLVLRNPKRDAKEHKGLLTVLDENPYVSMTLNTDTINSGGQTVTNGVPWAPNILLYEDNYSVACHGQFNMRFRFDGIYELTMIRVLPQIGAMGLELDPGNITPHTQRIETGFPSPSNVNLPERSSGAGVDQPWFSAGMWHGYGPPQAVELSQAKPGSYYVDVLTGDVYHLALDASAWQAAQRSVPDPIVEIGAQPVWFSEGMWHGYGPPESVLLPDAASAPGSYYIDMLTNDVYRLTTVRLGINQWSLVKVKQ